MSRLTRGAAIAAAALAIAAVEVGAASRPAYHHPPSYRGIDKAPKTVAAPAPPPTTLSDAGTFPDVLVDEAGTGHVVWNEDRGDLTDVVVYCRIKRSATACDARSDLRSEIGDDSPDARYDAGGNPKIVRIGDQLIVFSKRYPIVRDKPDGAGSSTVIAWTSGDGGTSWTATPSIVGKWNLGQMVVIGSDEDPTILNLGVDPLCPAPGPAALCVTAFKSGQYAHDEGNLSSAPDQNYYADLALDEHGRPVMAASDLAYDTYVRRWRGMGSPLDTNQWTPPTKVPADQSSIAGGPAGVYLMGKPKSGAGPYSVRRLSERGEGYAAGRPRAISAESDNVLGQLFQGPDGRLFAAWEQRGRGLLLRATAGKPAARASFGPAKRLARGDDNGQIALAAAGDGGGFIAFNHTGGVVGPGQIRVGGFGTQTPTGQAGVADIAGGGVVPGGAGTGGACGELSFGEFTVKAADGCLLKGRGARSGEYVTAGEVNLWGLRIIPDPGVKIVIEPKTLELNTTGDVRVVVTGPQPVGDVLLFRGPLHANLSKVVPGTNLFEFGTGLHKANVLGFDVASNINVRLERDGVHIPLALELPPAFGGFSGQAELVADRRSGLRVDSVRIHVGPVPLGALVVNSIDLEYAGGEDLWTGAGSVTVPAGGTLKLRAQFAMGKFKSASFSFEPGTPVPIGPFVYLLQFGGGFALDPVTIDANATIGAGVAVANESPIKARGDFRMTFPSLGPADFRLKGTVSLFMFQIGEGELTFQTDGYAAFRGHTGVELGPLEVDANVDGFVDAPTGQYGASLDGRVDLCAKVTVPVTEEVVRVCGGARAGVAVSSRGFAACGRINPPDPLGGFELGLSYPWKDWNPLFLTNPFALSASLLSHIGGCHVEDYKVAPTRARAAQAREGAPVTIGDGLPEATVLVKGAGGAPAVTATGPDGEVVETGGASDAGQVVTFDGIDAAYVMLREPAGGTWTIRTHEGSPAATEILTADGYEPVRVSARLGGKGRSRTIAYRLKDTGHGQRVVFQEEGTFGTHLLGVAKGGSGTLRFRPADARGGRRTVVALVQRKGITTDTVRVGAYVAPGPQRPRKVRRLRARRAGHSVVVSWRAARGAARHAVTVRGMDGTRLGRLVGRRKERIVFAGVRREEKVRVQVRALSAKLRSGPPRKLTLRPRR